MVFVDTGSFVFTGTFNSLPFVARFRSPSCFSFHKLLELGTNNLGPAALELFARECRKFRESFQANVSQFQPRFVAIGQQFEGDHGIALVSLIPPGVGEFLLRNHSIVESGFSPRPFGTRSRKLYAPTRMSSPRA